ncbi:MAG: hypothetical protein ACPG5B_03145 [Chitinophagales bacterium]
MITEILQNSLLEIIAILLITSFLVWLLTWLFTRWSWKRKFKNEQESHQETSTVLSKTLDDKNKYVNLFDDKSEEYNSLFGDKEALEVANQQMRQEFEGLSREKNVLSLNSKNLKANNQSQKETITELLVIKNDYGVLLEDYEVQQQKVNKLQVFHAQLKEERENLTAELTKERFENRNKNKLVSELKSKVSDIKSAKSTENDAFLKLKTDYKSDMRYLKEQLNEERNKNRQWQVRLQEKKQQLPVEPQKAADKPTDNQAFTHDNQAFTQRIETYKLQISQLREQLKKEQQAHLLLSQNIASNTDNNDADSKLLADLEASQNKYNDLLQKYQQLKLKNQANKLTVSQNAFSAVESQNENKQILADYENLAIQHQDLVKKYQRLESTQRKAAERLAIFAKQQQNYKSLEGDFAILRAKAEKANEMKAHLSNLESLNSNLKRKLARTKEEMRTQTAFSSEPLNDNQLAHQVKELQRKNGLLKEHNYQLSIDLDEVNKKMGSYEGKLSNLSRFKNDYQRLLDRSENWQNESNNLQKQISLLNEENAQFKDSINNLSVFRTKYKEVVRQNEQLGLKLHESHQNTVSKENDLLNLQTKTSQINDLEKQVSELNLSFQEGNKQISDLQQRLHHAVTQKQNLQQQLDKTQQELDKLASQQTVLLDEDAILYEISERSHLIDFSTIGLALAKDKEDLKKIKGIGEFIERKLNALGIYRFEQIAKFTDVEMEAITKAIDFFPGRIQRDKWVEQAKNLQQI